jgi:hypothetical protein
VEEEDARHLHRELERLKRERLAHRVRMQSLLVTQGLKLKVKRGLGLRFDGLTLCDGRALPEQLKAELERAPCRAFVSSSCPTTARQARQIAQHTCGSQCRLGPPVVLFATKSLA